MIQVKNFFNFLKKNKIDFFSGVPDSVLKDTKEILSKKSKSNHIIAANEGTAAAICFGYYLSTGKISCLYLQNSGLGNAINPLISIAHKKVYSIPLLMLIGWRGAPGKKDEPQHLVKGKITKKLLDSLDIKYCHIKSERDFKILKKLLNFSKKNKKPVACLISKNTFYSNFKSRKILQRHGVKREDFIRNLLTHVKKNTRIISTTGYTSRELYQIRRNEKFKKGKDFYMVGGMGHASSVALGVSLKKKKSNIICLDGDGALIMHLGSLANVGFYALKNFKHIVLNNYCHESVGGQDTNAENINLKNLSKSCGYKKYFMISNLRKINSTLQKFLNSTGPSFLEVKIKSGVLRNLKRPKDLFRIKNKFMEK